MINCTAAQNTVSEPRSRPLPCFFLVVRGLKMLFWYGINFVHGDVRPRGTSMAP